MWLKYVVKDVFCVYIDTRIFFPLRSIHDMHDIMPEDQVLLYSFFVKNVKSNTHHYYCTTLIT